MIYGCIERKVTKRRFSGVLVGRHEMKTDLSLSKTQGDENLNHVVVMRKEQI